MRIKFALAGIVLAASCLPASAASYGNLRVQTLHLDRTTPTYQITAMYPRTGEDAIDTQVAAWIVAQEDYFAHMAPQLALEPAPPPEPGMPAPLPTPWLDISYTITRNDKQMFETLFEFDIHTKAAHARHELHTLNFLPDGTRVFLPEVVGPAGMQKISQLAIDDLTQELTGGAEPITDAASIRRGAAVHPGAFEVFTITTKSIVVYFQEYQVAGFSAGPQRSEIPLSQLYQELHNDWRTPQPSFDCGQATSDIDRALCSDLALARLDRQLARAYYWKAEHAGNEAAKARLRNEQKAFAASRDSGCAGQTGSALTQCLTNAYQTRLQGFDLQPE